MSTTQPHDGAPRQPATITVVQTLLVLSAVGSAVGLIVSIYLVSLVLDLLARFRAAFSPFAGGGDTSSSTIADASSTPTVPIILAVVQAVAVVVVSIWAFREIGRGQAVARLVLAGLAGVQLVLSVATTLTAGAGVGLVVVDALVGLLVFDAPVLFLLFVPAESRRWFTAPAATPALQGPAAADPRAWAGQPPSWSPSGPGGPPRSAPFPAARPSGPFPQPPARGPQDGPPVGGGRHSAPRPPQR